LLMILVPWVKGPAAWSSISRSLSPSSSLVMTMASSTMVANILLPAM